MTSVEVNADVLLFLHFQGINYHGNVSVCLNVQHVVKTILEGLL